MRKKYISGSALLQGCKEPVSNTVVNQPMVLTLDEMAPNPDNPRKFRNPRYNEIKESIRARGLDTVPKLTKNPQESDSLYVFSYGGNTRYQVLLELYEETQEERFYRIPVVIIPWPGRLQCLLGHLSENDVRGDLTYLEKAMGVQKARELYQTEKNASITLRDLSKFITREGFPIDYSTISRMEKALQFLYPVMPVLMESGYMSRTKAGYLIDMRKSAEEVWHQYQYSLTNKKPEISFDELFAQVCQKFDDPDLYSLDSLRDELIGELLLTLPHPSLTYDHWLLELDPREQQRKKLIVHTGTELTVPHNNNIDQPESAIPVADNHNYQKTSSHTVPAEHADNSENICEHTENTSIIDFTHNDNPYIDTPYTGKTVDNIPETKTAPAETTLLSALPSSARESTTINDSDITSNSVSNINDNSDIWMISELEDDILHLQVLAFKLAFEIVTDSNDMETVILEDCKSEKYSCGYKTETAKKLISGQSLLATLLQDISGSESIEPGDFINLFIGDKNQAPHLTDTQTIHLFRLIRIVRRIRELQRQIISKAEDDTNE